MGGGDLQNSDSPSSKSAYLLKVPERRRYYFSTWPSDGDGTEEEGFPFLLALGVRLSVGLSDPTASALTFWRCRARFFPVFSEL